MKVCYNYFALFVNCLWNILSIDTIVNMVRSGSRRFSRFWCSLVSTIRLIILTPTAHSFRRMILDDPKRSQSQPRIGTIRSRMVSVRWKEIAIRTSGHLERIRSLFTSRVRKPRMMAKYGSPSTRILRSMSSRLHFHPAVHGPIRAFPMELLWSSEISHLRVPRPS